MPHQTTAKTHPSVSRISLVRVGILLVACCGFPAVVSASATSGHSEESTESRPMIRGTAGRYAPPLKYPSDDRPLVDLEERLLWRNETPRDDDDAFGIESNPFNEAYNSNRNNHHGNNNNNNNNNMLRPGVAVHAMVVSRPEIDSAQRDRSRSGFAVAAMKMIQSMRSGDEGGDEDEDEDEDSLEGNEDEKLVIGRGDMEFDSDFESLLGSSNSTVESSNATEVAAVPSDDNDNDNDWYEIALDEEPGHDDNDRGDCEWSVATATGCGDAAPSSKHETVVADGRCRYNDVLGFYRAGCSRPASSNADADGTAGTTAAAAAAASIFLQDVFCTDPACSRGCFPSRSFAMVPGVPYASGVCYASGLDSGSANANGTLHHHDALEHGMGGVNDSDLLEARNAEQGSFSFEFVGACSESENCHVVAE